MESVSEEQVSLEIDSSEFVDSHSLDPNLQPVIYYTDPIDTEAQNSGLDEHLQITSSELMDQLNLPSEPLGSEFDNAAAKPNKRKRKSSKVWDHFKLESVGEGCMRAICNECKQSYAYSIGSKVYGTSHLKRHIPNGACTVMLRQQQDRFQLAKSKPRRPRRLPLEFDQELCRNQISRMIIMHEYPLHMVDHPEFLAFVKNLQPRFEILNFNTLQGDCVDTYLKGKQNLQKIIDEIPGKISLALDTRGSYVFIYAQFIDQDWKLHRQLLNIVIQPVSIAVGTCLSYWNLQEKLFAITLNQPVGLVSAKTPLILVGRCIARTLSGLAQDALSSEQETVSKIRSSVKYVSDERLVLDTATKWNTTYEMLLAAREFKEVFCCIEDGPSEEDWKRVDFICGHFKLLVEIADLLIRNPSADVFFNEVWKIQLQVQTIGGISQERFSDYWKDTYLVLSIAVAMDPRYKMKLVEFRFTDIFGDEADEYLKVVDKGIRDLFKDYIVVNDDVIEVESIGFSDFDVYIMESCKSGVKSELDEYLEESVMPRVDLDVLGWWKMNEVKYPALSKMARDVLGVPMSSVGPDCVFDTVGREMGEYWSSLRPEMVEALMCAKSWMQDGLIE